MGGLANGFAQLFKQGSKRFGNAIDNFWLDAEARKAIEDEVRKKFQPKIDRFNTAASRRATNITELDKKLAQSKQDLQAAKDKWQQDYDDALADAKNQRQAEIDNFDKQLQGYQDTLTQANKGRQDIIDQLYDQEAKFDQSRTVFIDVNTGDRYIFNPRNGTYDKLDTYYKGLKQKEQRKLDSKIQQYETRLFDPNSGNKVINAFDNYGSNGYIGKPEFDNYLQRLEGQNATALRNANRQISQATNDLNTWKKKTRPSAWSVNESNKFKNTYEQTNGELPKEYSFNGQTYSKETDLDAAYQKALGHAQKKRDDFNKKASGLILDRNKEIAQRIQDAKDIKKAKLALGAGAGAGALAAGAAALYGGDDTDNTDNTDNTTYGEPDPDFNVENTPEGQAQLKSDTASINTDFDPDKADALASAAYDQGVEDGNSARSSGDLVNSIAAATGGHTIDDRLFELIKAMQDPYKADAVANYIYSRHGDDPEVQRLGWRGWLNKYYGDSLRSRMNIDPSGYKSMHVSGGL